MRTIRNLAVVAVLVIGATAMFAADMIVVTPLDAGYRDMYNLQFGEAHKQFQMWQQQHPEDPLGPVSDAAAYLFDEFDRLHVLETKFFVNDQKFESRSRPSPNAEVKQSFQSQLARTRDLAQQALARNQNDSNALFANVLANGLEGDYLALIEKRDMQALKLMKEGRTIAERLLVSDPNCYDAYLAVGVENYLLSLKPAPLRWMLRVTGAQTDKTIGIEKLRMTAEKGHYLLPFARLLLAVAALRDHDQAKARGLLQDLAKSYPANHLYQSELAKLE